MIAMKIINSIKKRIIYILFKLPVHLKFSLLSNCNNVKGKPRFIQPCQLNGLGLIIFKKNVMIGYDPSPFMYSGYGYIEARNKVSSITIGENTVINNNVVMISEGEGIIVGRDVLIGTQCEIYDSDFHNLGIHDRLTGKAKTGKVEIEDNVFIGSNVKILKGVTIGKNSIIANGSVVAKSIPQNVIAGGVPAKIISRLST
jgi:maltose O-acetyltransferase